MLKIANPDGAAKPAFSVRRLLSHRWVQYLLAAGVLFALWRFDRLRLDDVRRLEFRPFWACLALVLLFPNYIVAAFRLQCVLLGMGAPCSFRQAWHSTLYGAIGELSLPVFAGGDLVKAVHVGSAFNRSTAAASVVADRIIGLVGLIVFGALACVAQLPSVWGDVRLRSLAVWLAVALAAIVVGVWLTWSFRTPFKRRFRGLALRLAGGESILRLAGRFVDLARRPHLLYSLALAAFGHLIWCASVVCLSFALSIDIPVLPAMLVLPLVAACNTLSFAGGIGGGTLAFEYLFQHVLGTPPGAGCQVGIAMPLLVNLSKLYALPWLLGPVRKTTAIETPSAKAA